jgi:hypothetical protein
VATTRAFIAQALRSADRPRNGLSAEEMASLPETLRPLAQGLVMIARIDDIPRRPGPMSLRPFREGVAHVVNLIKNADGGNRRVSEAEIGALADQLESQGRWAEAIAVKNLFTIAKKLDGSRKVVGFDDLDGAAAWAIAQIKKRDRGAPGFSNGEIAQFPETWRALGHVGFAIEGGVIEKATRRHGEGGGDAAALARRLERLVEGEYYISESDYPFEAYSHALSPTRELTDDVFRDIHNVPAEVRVYSYPANEFFQYYKDAGEHGAESAAKFAALEREMQANLHDIQIFKIGDEAQVEVKFFLVGRDTDGAIVGLRSISIET